MRSTGAPEPESEGYFSSSDSSGSEFDNDAFADDFDNEMIEDEMEEERKEVLRRVSEILQVPKAAYGRLQLSCKVLKNAVEINPFFNAIKTATSEEEKEAARKRLDEKIIEDALKNDFKDYEAKIDMKKCDCEVKHGDYVLNEEDKLVCKRCGVVGSKTKKKRKKRRSRPKSRNNKQSKKQSKKQSQRDRRRRKRSKTPPKND